MYFYNAIFLVCLAQIVIFTVCLQAQPEDCHCGYKEGDDIINGQYVTDIYKYPWLVSLWSRGARCTGALISPTAVLTAAHCNPKADPTNTEVRFLGEFGKPRKVFKVGKIVNHPRYEEELHILTKHDIAIWFMKGSTKCRGDIIPLCIPAREYGEIGLNVIIAGSGREVEKKRKKPESGRTSKAKNPQMSNPNIQYGGNMYPQNSKWNPQKDKWSGQMSNMFPQTGSMTSKRGSMYPQTANMYSQKASTYPKRGSMYPQMANRYPQMLSSYPQMGSRYPQMGSGYTQMGSKNPQMGSGYTQMGSGYPQMGSRYPQMGSRYTQRNGRNPQMGSMYPQRDSMYTQMERMYPERGNSYPQMGSMYPQRGSSYPQMGSSYPQMGSSYPQMGSSYPQMGSMYQQMGSSYPQMGSMRPQMSGMRPQMSGRYSKMGSMNPQMKRVIKGESKKKKSKKEDSNEEVPNEEYTDESSEISEEESSEELDGEAKETGQQKVWKMKEGTAKIVARERCNIGYLKGIPDDAAHCIQGTNNSTTCQGDSGSSMFIERNKVFYSLGVTSGSAKDGCKPHALKIFTNTYAHRRFIKDNVRDLPTPRHGGRKEKMNSIFGNPDIRRYFEQINSLFSLFNRNPQ